MAYLKPSEVAALLGVSAKTVKRLAVAGKLAGLRVGEQWRISAAAVADYEARNTTTAEDVQAAPPREKEVTTRAVTTIDGFTLPADYEPVFKDLWPGHEPRTTKAASQRH